MEKTIIIWRKKSRVMKKLMPDIKYYGKKTLALSRVHDPRVMEIKIKSYEKINVCTGSGSQVVERVKIDSGQYELWEFSVELADVADLRECM